MNRAPKQVLMSCIILSMLGVASMAQATLVTIGTAIYGGLNYNLVWDSNNNGNSVVWLDYTNQMTDWNSQMGWATGLNGPGVLSYNIDPSQWTVDWGANDWRLPTTVDGLYVNGYEGDPDHDGNYNYTGGYNLENSEMGHLFYGDDALNNIGYQNTDGSVNPIPSTPDAFLQKIGPFKNLSTSWFYWSGTEYAGFPHLAWEFYMGDGKQGYYDENLLDLGLAVRNANGSRATPTPEPATLLLFGTGLVGLIAAKRKKD